MKPIIVISGPTACGKTDIAISIAKKYNAEIISADSRQVYKKLSIGTAKPTQEQLNLVPHHLIDVVDPKESFNVADFKKQADLVVEDILKRGKNIVIAGGTGLYIKAFIWGLSNVPNQDPKLRQSFKERIDKEGLESLHQELSKVDSQSAKEIHVNDEVRIVRALEIFYLTGKTKSFFSNQHQFQDPRYPTLYFIITPDRFWLYPRIESRVDEMMQAGLEKEVRSLLDQGYSFKDEGLATIGYQEFEPYIAGQCELEQVIHGIKKSTKQFAKRQYIWNRGIKPKIEINMEDNFEIEKCILKQIK